MELGKDVSECGIHRRIILGRNGLGNSCSLVLPDPSECTQYGVLEVVVVGATCLRGYHYP